MITSSVLNSVTFKNLTGSYPNASNTLHALRAHGNSKIISYYQKWNTGHVIYLQFESDSAVSPTLKSYNGTVEIETFSVTTSKSYGTISVRYFYNFIVTLDGEYTNKKFYFKLTQSAITLTSEPCYCYSMTDDLAKGIIKYIKYTNLDRIESDLDSRFVDWSILASTGNYMDFFIEAVDVEMNESDESEVLEGSQSKTVLSAAYFTGRTLKTGGVPDYMVARLGMASSLDVFTVNDIQYIKDGEVGTERFGGSTSFQCSIKLTQKNAIGINVDNIGISDGGSQPPIVGVPMYVGSVTSAAPNETEVKLITSAEATRANQAKTYTITGARFCFAYPTSYGSLSSILDTVGDEIITGFNVTTLDFTIDGNTVSYTIYTLKNLATVTSFTVTYKFNI